MVRRIYKISHCDPQIDVSKQSNGVHFEQEMVNRNRTNFEIETTVAPTRLYKRRWYILAVYSLLTFTQACVWNTFGPIAVSCEKAFGWNVSIIALLPNWGPISFLISAWFTSWIIDRKGVRFACTVASLLLAFGSSIRCITTDPPYITWTANIAAFLSGLGGPVALCVPPVLSATWFPPYQRTTATAIGTAFNFGGVAASFLIGTYFVPEVTKGETEISGSSTLWNTTTTSNLKDLIMNTEFSSHQDEVEEEITRIRNQVLKLLYTECTMSLVVVLLILLYFPAKPPMPPSTTASKERKGTNSGIKALVRNRTFLTLNVIYGVPIGILTLWASVLDVNLKSYDISESQAGWIGFYSIMAGCVGSFVMARFSDVFTKHFRHLLILIFSLSSVCFLWFNLIINGFIPNSIPQIYVSVIFGTLLMNASVPLMIEMACEITYPVSEGITTIILAASLNVVGLIFLGVQMIPGVGTAWENWSILVSIVVCIPVLFLMNDQYNRLSIDERTIDRVTESN